MGRAVAQGLIVRAGCESGGVISQVGVEPSGFRVRDPVEALHLTSTDPCAAAPMRGEKKYTSGSFGIG